MKFKSYITLTLLIFLGAACKKDFLNVVPKGKQVAVTTQDYNLLMNSSNLYVLNFAGGWQSLVLMGDEVAAEGSMFSNAQVVSQNAFKWEADIFRSTDIDWTARLWLEQIYTLNKVINEVQSSTGGTDAQKAQIRAEAMANRAFINFQFVNLYGKPYVAATAGTDPGFPIITTADITENNFIRNSVQADYDAVISDLNVAIATLPAAHAGGKTRFSKASAEGILGKVYLFMGKNTEALAMFNAALNDNASAASPAVLYDYNTEFADGGKFVPIQYNGPNNAPGNDYNDVTESVLARSFYNYAYSGNGFGNDFLVITPQMKSLFGSSDFRLNFYAPQFPYQQENPSGRLSKYSVMYSKFGVQLSELYLLRAEAKARLNDFTGAKADVETLRKNRMPVADATVPTAAMAGQKPLLQFIFDERLREFAAEGYRWMDMRRLSVDPLFAGTTYTHILYNDNVPNTTNVTTFTLSPLRLTLKLSPFIMNSNKQFTNNP